MIVITKVLMKVTFRQLSPSNTLEKGAVFVISTISGKRLRGSANNAK